MRGHCEFNNCYCDEYHGLDNKCLLCKHGKCWHKIIENNTFYSVNQFISTRQYAHKPTYIFAFNGYRKEEKIEEYPKENFCNSVDDLPA